MIIISFVKTTIFPHQSRIDSNRSGLDYVVRLVELSCMSQPLLYCPVVGPYKTFQSSLNLHGYDDVRSNGWCVRTIETHSWMLNYAEITEEL